MAIKIRCVSIESLNGRQALVLFLECIATMAVAPSVGDNWAIRRSDRDRLVLLQES